MNITRRQLLAALGCGALLHPGIRAGATGLHSPVIGGSRAAFSGTFPEVGTAGEYTHFRHDGGAATEYYVRFDENGVATQIVADYRQNPGGTLPLEAGQTGFTRFAPQDSSYSPEIGTYRLAESTSRAYRVHHSPALAAALGNTGYLVALDGIARDGMVLLGYAFTLVSLESSEVHEIIPRGTDLGLHSPKSDWEQQHGLAPAQGGWVVQNPPTGAEWTWNENRLVITPDPAFSTAEAARIIGDRLPTSAQKMFSTWIAPSPVAAYGIRIHAFALNDIGQTIVTTQFVDGDEATGTVADMQMHMY